MLSTTTRFLLPPLKSYFRLAPRALSKAAAVGIAQNATTQMDYIKSIIENNTNDWSLVRNTILSIYGTINEKNVDGVLFKVMINNKKIDTALSFAKYVKNSSDDLNFGSINGLLGVYYEIGKDNALSEEERHFILNTYESLCRKYKILDSTTCERLLHALCVIDEWEKALKLLDDIHLSGNPTHSAYSTIIATLFRNDKSSDAMKLIERSLNNRRPLQHVAYEAWIDYIIRKYKYNKTKLKYLDEICLHISRNCAIITMETAVSLQNIYASLDYDAQFTKIRKQSGQCSNCKDTLDCLKLSKEEFNLLQQNVKEKLIVGSDLFLKTSPTELQRFLKFIERTAPYDIVLDALNIAYASKRGLIDKMELLKNIVDHFAQQNKKILLLGRKHMLKWPRRSMEYVMNKTCSFFTENLSEDDPYFITAAILSGSHTDIVSKDLLRGHRYLMKDEQLRLLFQRWQWQHQWMVFAGNKEFNIQAPIKYTPCAQKKNNCWHLPFEKEGLSTPGQINDGIPNLSTWLCLRPKLTEIN